MQIQEKDFQEAIIALKKDTRLVAAAKNDRTNSPEGLYREFEKLPIERQREIINSLSTDFFVAAQWKIVFPMNQFSGEVLTQAVRAVGKTLFFTRDEDSVRETVRAFRLFQQSPFLNTMASLLGEAAEICGPRTAVVARILTSHELFGLIRSMDQSPANEKIITTIGKVAIYTGDREATEYVAQFLFARRYSPHLEEICRLLESSIFLARDPRSVGAIVEGLTAGGIDAVLQRNSSNPRQVLASIHDVAWKSRNPRIISAHIQSYLRGYLYSKE